MLPLLLRLRLVEEAMPVHVDYAVLAVDPALSQELQAKVKRLNKSVGKLYRY